MDNEKLLAVLDRLMDKPVQTALVTLALQYHQQRINAQSPADAKHAPSLDSVRHLAQEIAVTVNAAHRVQNDRVFEALIERLGWSTRDADAALRHRLLTEWAGMEAATLEAAAALRLNTRIAQLSASLAPLQTASTTALPMPPKAARRNHAPRTHAAARAA